MLQLKSGSGGRAFRRMVGGESQYTVDCFSPVKASYILHPSFFSILHDSFFVPLLCDVTSGKAVTVVGFQ